MTAVYRKHDSRKHVNHGRVYNSLLFAWKELRISINGQAVAIWDLEMCENLLDYRIVNDVKDSSKLY